MGSQGSCLHGRRVATSARPADGDRSIRHRLVSPSMQSGSRMGQAVAMAITLPLPVRVAAGILGAGIDLLRALPDDIPAIPVTIVGNAMRLSMTVQQEIASLATRGDELLSGVIGAPEESPTWAKFDDDEPTAPVTPIRPAGRTKPGSGTTKAAE